ncbi:MAG: bdhA 2 [Microbacteriaceae bacterium]|jgi:NAD(P)-dependent dehydrogenase (short-subunit alcohol dehydrogenase family)|nr:bdhA 2 [Microbacteriaceae bacterium]
MTTDDSTDAFAGGVAVITGAGSGIGAGLVSYAARLGMRIALADVNADAVAERVEQLRADGVDAIWRRVDVRESSDLETLAADVYDTWGTTTVLVNNAGIELHGNTWELPVDHWHRVIDINLNGVFHGIHAFVPRMIAGGTRAHVVNVSSVAALRTNPGTSAYAATKHATLALTECLAKELEPVAPFIAVTAVLPGSVKSAIFESAYVNDVDGAGAESKRILATSMEQTGLEPIDAARIIFEGVARGDLRVHTNPEASRRFIAERAAALAF